MTPVLIDAILGDGDSNGPESERTFTPPPGWRTADVNAQQQQQQEEERRSHDRRGSSGAGAGAGAGAGYSNGAGAGDDNKTYTEEQRQGVLRYLHNLHGPELR